MDKLVKSQKGVALMDIQHYRDTFEKHGGMMSTKELEQVNIRTGMSNSSLKPGMWRKCGMVIING